MRLFTPSQGHQSSTRLETGRTNLAFFLASDRKHCPHLLHIFHHFRHPWRPGEEGGGVEGNVFVMKCKLLNFTAVLD